MATRKIMIMVGAVLLVLSFIGSVHSQVLERRRLTFINSDINIAENGILQQTTGMNIQISEQVNLAERKELLIIAQSRDQFEFKRKKLLGDKEVIENQIELVEKNIKDIKERLINDLEDMQLSYDQRVRMCGTDDTSIRMLNDISNKRERGELDIKQQKRRLANLYEELKNIQNKLEELKMP